MPFFDKINALLVSDSYVNRPLLEKKVALLRSQLSLLIALVGVFYIIVDSSFGYLHNLHIYAGLFAAAAVVLVLNRKGYEQLSNLILLITVNFVVYIFAASDIHHKVGSGVFFIPIAFCSITIYGYKHRYRGLSFAALSGVLFYISVYVDFSLIRVPDDSFPDYVFRQFYLINVMTCIVIGVMNISFFLRINHDSETELMVSKKKIEEAFAKLDKLFYVVSHDLKAPLHSIRGLINISKHTSDSVELKEYLKMIEERTHASEAFIAEIADYSKSTNTSVIESEIDLHHLVKETVELVKYGDKASGINFIISIPEHFIIMSDLLRVRIILSNLIGNAIQYHHHERTNRFIKISAEARHDQIEIVVADNGIGIDKEHLGKIFQMFYRANTQVSGSGLGLYLVQDAINTLKGSVAVDSTPKEGTRFHVFLPMHSAHLPSEADRKPELQEA